MGGDGLASAEFASIGGAAVEGTLMTFGPDPTKKPQAAEVVKKFEAKKINPESYTLYSYAAVQVIKQAAEKAGSLDPKKVAEAMHSGMTFNTVIGSFAYDAKGDRKDAEMTIFTMKGAKIAPIAIIKSGKTMSVDEYIAASAPAAAAPARSSRREI